MKKEVLNKRFEKMTYRQKVKNFLAYQYPGYKLIHIKYNDKTIESWNDELKDLKYTLFIEITDFYDKM